MDDFFKQFCNPIYFSDELHRKYAEEKIESEIKWRKWISTTGKIFKEIKFPPTALIDRFHFSSYVYGCTDFFNYEPFDLNDLSDIEALQVLLALETYIELPFECWIIMDLRERFNIPCEEDDSSETFPHIPQNLIDRLLK
jgi:hypothetical protein